MLKELDSVTRSIGYEGTVEHVIPTLDELVSDAEAHIRQTLVEQLPTLSVFLIEAGEEDGYARVLDVLVPLVEDFLVDQSAQVRTSAGASLFELAKLLKPGDLDR